MPTFKTILAAVFCMCGMFVSGYLSNEMQHRQLLIEKGLARYNAKSGSFELIPAQEIVTLPDVMMPLPQPEPVKPAKKHR